MSNYGIKNTKDYKFLKFSFSSKKKNSTPMGFEPTRAEPIGLAVQRLNHSATSSYCWKEPIIFWW